jgi:pyrimidine deaminase RibD-like protein/NTP pyrophosphatase (non-canonical NTP hydrolase)
MPWDQFDLDCMQLAIDESKNCIPEDDHIVPVVGAVVAMNGVMLASAFRGKAAPGDHAEFCALEKELANVDLRGTTVYTTLEPCTQRSKKKTPCVDRLIRRGVDRVVIGMLDPNRIIRGKGQMLLRDVDIDTGLFPREMAKQVEELNHQFILHHRHPIGARPPSEELFIQNRSRSLDDWYQIINSIYWDKNFYRSRADVLSHLVEVIGGLSLLASEKKKSGVQPEDFVAKALAWWLALCAKVGIRSVSDLIWAKFPAVCAYCHQSPHKNSRCRELKKTIGLDWAALKIIAADNKPGRPQTLGHWQRMFNQIYEAEQTEPYATTFGRLSEEIGELAETIRIFPAAPGYFLSEAADVFAWLMRVQNMIDERGDVTDAERGDRLERLFCFAYPDYCTDCGDWKCSCAPILDSTIGRIAHELPTGLSAFDETSGFMTSAQAVEYFKRRG